MWIIPTVNANQLTLVGGDDDLFLSAGITLAAWNGTAVIMGLAGNPNAFIHGTIVGKRGLATIGSTDLVIDVGGTGRVTGLDETAMRLSALRLTLDNAGVIESLSVNSAAILCESIVPGSWANITNSGLIEGQSAIVLEASIGTFRLDNSGTIRAASFALNDQSADGTTTVFNTGLIDGEVFMGAGNDLFDGTNGRLDGGLYGGSGNDALMTGAGAQTILGGQGSDVLMGGAGGDALVGGEGRDFASYARATAGVRADLVLGATNAGEARGDRLVGVESLIGSNFADVLNGDAQFNVVSGGAGGDVLRGRGGNDILIGQGGADRFVFDTAPSATANADRILDFQRGVDDVVLENAVYAALAAGALAPGAFRASLTGLAGDAGDRILHETDTGWLSYDRDGTGAAAAVRFAQVNAGLNLTAGDFVVV